MVLVFAVPGRTVNLIPASESEDADIANVPSFLHMLPGVTRDKHHRLGASGLPQADPWP